MPPNDSQLKLGSNLRHSPVMKRTAKTKKREKESANIKDVYLQLENELQREMEHLRFILSHIDNQKSKLKTEETVLLAMLGESSDITSRETLTPVFHEPESFDFFSSELPDIGSSDLFNPQERHINPKSIDLDIANALSILENMSDCEAEDIEQTAPSPSSVAEESWGEPTQQSPVYDSDGDHEIDDDDDDMAREALSKMLAIYS